MIGLGAVGLAVFGLLVLTAVGAGSAPGTTRTVELAWSIDIGQIISTGIGILIIAAILIPLISGRRQENSQKKRKGGGRRQSPIIVILFVVLAIGVLFMFRPESGPAEEEGAASVGNISEVVFLPVTAVGSTWPLLILVAGAALAILAVTRLSRLQLEIDDDQDFDPGALIADTLSGAIDALSWADDPRSVIIKAYYEIEASLAAAGLPRRASEAPREYLRRVLTSIDVPRDQATTLTRLFEKARYSRHALGEIDKQDAITAMEAVLESLGSPVR